MTRYELISRLVGHVEQYEQEEPQELREDHFALWLANRIFAANAPAPPAASGPVDLNSNITIAVTYLYRFAKGYIKKALDGSDLKTADDFIFLLLLQLEGGMTKTQLINRLVLEKTSGMEVIRRLLAKGLIDEQPGADKRSKLVQINDRGRAALGQVYHQMNQVSQIVGGTLSTEEKIQLVGLLKKLQGFHQAIYTEQKDAPLGQIIEDRLPASDPPPAGAPTN